MIRSLLVVDGTNVSWAWPRARPLMVAGRHQHAQALLLSYSQSSPLLTQHDELVIVFDGPPHRLPGVRSPRVRILYPDPGTSADHRIIELVEAHRHRGAPARLVSSDRALRDAVRNLGATTMGAMELISVIDRRGGDGPDRPPRARGEKPLPSAEDTRDWLRRFNHHERRRGQKEGDSR